MDRLSLVAIALVLLVAGGLWYVNKGNVVTGNVHPAHSLFTLATSSAETIFTVTDNGNVGIGTASPAATLDVAGAIRLSKKSVEGCGSATEGEIAYNPDNKRFWGCDGVSWHALDN